MPAVAPYIPAKDAALANWLANFSALITASPSTYGLTAVDAVNISGPVGDFADAYALVTSPDTKTASTVSAKNTARTIALAVVRPYAQAVALNPGVASADKVALGLNPRTSLPAPITAPNSNPVLTIQSGSHLSLVLRYRDSASGVAGKGKPYGAISCQIFGAVSATPVTDPSAMQLLATATKSPFQLQFDASAGGKQVYLAARWITRKGLTSGWSPVVNFTVPMGA